MISFCRLSFFFKRLPNLYLPVSKSKLNSSPKISSMIFFFVSRTDLKH